MSRSRLDIYDDYPADAIEEVIDQWIHNYKHKLILRYKLVYGYTYDQTANLVSKDIGQYVSTDSVKRAVYKAENKLFKRLEIIYKH